MTRRTGFSLLELMVALALVALLAALALPNAARIVDNLARRSEYDRILDQLASIGADAMLRRRAYVVFGANPPRPEELDAYADFEPYALRLAEGWRLHLDKPLLARPNGVCLGAKVTLRREDDAADGEAAAPAVVTLAPPFCRVPDDA